MIDFRFHIEDETYVVWLAGINRYLQLKKPAFQVFEQWAKDQEISKIIKDCAEANCIPGEESKRFVEEIISELRILYETNLTQVKNHSTLDSSFHDPEFHAEHTYRIGDHFFRFVYRNEYLKKLFHPLFLHQETTRSPAGCTSVIIYSTGESDLYCINDSASHSYLPEEIDLFQGAVFMEILNVIHSKDKDDWMGVLHASAVSDGQGAVIFTAPSGNGKSTIAMLMMANGFNILSDDFVPVSLNEPEIFHFPAGISVKKSAVTFLKEYLPQFSSAENEENEIFLPISGNPGILDSVKAKTIVFVTYDPSIEFELKKVSNLKLMNLFIEQSWIAGTPQAAGKFLDWYFNLPLYTLRYYNNSKAVEGIRGLF